jgi:lambda repressor-like predicted transcriptional regulator
MDLRNNGEDPTARRRQDREAMNDRDAEAWRLQRAGWSVRSIGRELGMAASSVQRCLQRAQRLANAITTVLVEKRSEPALRRFAASPRGWALARTDLADQAGCHGCGGDGERCD